MIRAYRRGFSRLTADTQHVQTRRLAWWMFVSLNAAVPLLSLLAVIVALHLSGHDECSGTAGGQHLAGSLVGIATLLLPITLLLDLWVGIPRRNPQTWRRVATLGGILCVASIFPLLLAAFVLAPLCW
jgi:hypothetical protein